MSDLPQKSSIVNSAISDRGKTILYISEIYPVNSHASSVVLYRHLSSLEKIGFKILLILPEYPEIVNELPKTWDRILLPPRRFYYPPYRQNSFLKVIRWSLIYNDISHCFTGRQIHCIIGILYGQYLMYFTGWLAERLSIPFFLFYHDQAELLNLDLTSKKAIQMRMQNLRLLANPMLRRVWLASPELAYEENKNDSIYSVLYPLPEEIHIENRASWRESLSRNLIVVYAGALYDQVIPALRSVAAALKELGGQLVIFTKLRQNALLLGAEFPNTVSYLGHVPNHEFYNYLSKEASAFLVLYPDSIEAMPWSLNCFPSKFVQLVHTGLPGIILAPKGTSIAIWCQKHKYTLYSSLYSNDSIVSLLSKVQSKDSWIQASNESLSAASTDFRCDSIDRKFTEEILSL